MTNKSHLTAISRKASSIPMRGLYDKGLLTGRALDYGCGKGYDAIHFGLDSYDPHYQPVMPDGRFDTITCNYVLNVIESESERLSVLQDIQARLVNTGMAYITVRADKDKLNGTTSIGTWQGLIMLDLPIVQRGSGYITYQLDHSTQLV
jgi:hypothetical protein